MTAAAHEPATASFLAATQALLRARGEQRGAPRFGDEADACWLNALLDLDGSPPHANLARESGATLGREIYARRVFEDSMPRCLLVLSMNVERSGWGSFDLEEHFHRTATTRFAPSAATRALASSTLSALVEGVLEGTFAEAFNCRAEARKLAAHSYEIALREGRDVNAGGRA